MSGLGTREMLYVRGIGESLDGGLHHNMSVPNMWWDTQRGMRIVSGERHSAHFEEILKFIFA